MKKTILLLLSVYCLLLSVRAQSWHAVGIPCGADVGFLKVYKGHLYAASLSFTNPCGGGFDGVGKFDGSYWDTLGIFDMIAGSADIEEYNGELYLAGGAVLSGNPWPNDWIANAYGLAKWNGIQWRGVDTINNPNGVSGITELKYKGDLYLGGSLTSAGGINCKKIIRYNGSTWDNMQGGIDGGFFPTVNTMAVYNGELYAAGEFDIAGIVPCNNVARWNGTQWDSVGSGIVGRVWNMITDTINNILYAGGELYSADGIPVRNIAKWDGVKWDSVGSGFPNVIHGMTMFNGELFVGGGASSFSDTVLGKWNGVNWTPIPGLNGGINSLATYKGNIYAGGPFTAFGDSINGGTVTNGLVCYGDSCPLNVGIHENAIQSFNFKIYPNPAKNNITIETEINKTFIMHITNPLGQKVAENKFQQKTEIDISSFGKGLFLVEVCDEKGVKCHTEKVLIN